MATPIGWCFLAMHLQDEKLSAAAEQLIDHLLSNAPVFKAESTSILALASHIAGFLRPTAAVGRRWWRHRRR